MKKLKFISKNTLYLWTAKYYVVTSNIPISVSLVSNVGDNTYSEAKLNEVCIVKSKLEKKLYDKASKLNHNIAAFSIGSEPIEFVELNTKEFTKENFEFEKKL